VFMSMQNGRQSVDHDRVLINGVPATQLTRETVYQYCADQKIPGIRADMGRGSLIDALAKHHAMWGPAA
jgi:hypothetical protein